VKSRVAIVHDYLTQRGGAERVVLAMLRAFPGAPVYTTLYEARGTFPEFAEADVRTSPLDRISLLRRHHRLALPLLAPVVSAMRVDADVLVCSSSGWAHGVGGDQPRVVYCYAPARWLYQGERYLKAGRGGRRVGSVAMAVLAGRLRRWDQRAALRATRYLAISNHVRALIRESYRIDAEVVHPPVTFDVTGPRRPLAGLTPGFDLCVSRLMAYKHVDAVVGAYARHRGRQLVVIGDGPEARRLRRIATSNVRFVGTIGDDELRWAYANASLLVAAAYEDFGLTPLEANAFGVPVVVLRWGGYLDTVVEGTTGMFFDEPTPPAIADALDEATQVEFSTDELRAHAASFSEERFAGALHAIVADVTKE